LIFCGDSRRHPHNTQAGRDVLRQLQTALSSSAELRTGDDFHKNICDELILEIDFRDIEEIRY
jgi:hypothetical protein